MASFDDVQLPTDMSRGFTSTPRFDTTIATSGAGYEQRNQNWMTPRREYEINYDVWDQTRLNQLIAFYIARGGRARGFRFRDWTDWYVGMVYSVTSGVVSLTYDTPVQFGTGNGATTAFQLTKTYADTINPTARKITRPVTGTVKIYLNGVEQTSGVTVNYSTGLITFTTAPSSGVAIAWCGQFDVPVRFDTDSLQFDMQFSTTGVVKGATIIELRE